VLAVRSFATWQGEAAHMSELFQAYVDALVMQRQQEKKTSSNTGTRGKFF
jgi:hypothetical protein